MHFCSELVIVENLTVDYPHMAREPIQNGTANDAAERMTDLGNSSFVLRLSLSVSQNTPNDSDCGKAKHNGNYANTYFPGKCYRV